MSDGDRFATRPETFGRRGEWVVDPETGAQEHMSWAKASSRYLRTPGLKLEGRERQNGRGYIYYVTPMTEEDNADEQAKYEARIEEAKKDAARQAEDDKRFLAEQRIQDRETRAGQAAAEEARKAEAARFRPGEESGAEYMDRSLAATKKAFSEWTSASVEVEVFGETYTLVEGGEVSQSVDGEQYGNVTVDDEGNLTSVQINDNVRVTRDGRVIGTVEGGPLTGTAAVDVGEGLTQGANAITESVANSEAGQLARKLGSRKIPDG